MASNAHRFISEANIHVENGSWTEGKIRVSDLADQIGQLANLDPTWRVLADELRVWAAALGRLARKEKQPFSQRKWINLVGALHRKIDSCLALFDKKGEDET